MKTFLKFFKIVLLMSGVFAAETDEGKSVMEGDSVTLNPDPTQIQGFIQMLWRFEDPGPVIAQIDGNEISYTSDERFRDRLQLNQTGSLIIMNMRTKHSGLYKLDIDRSTGTSYKTFSVTVYESPSVIARAETEMKIMSEMEGDPVTLHVPPLQGNELIVWRFGDEGKLIAKHDIEATSSPLYDTDERFRDRLQLNDQTGSLIITNTRTTDSGLYTVKISSNKQTSYKRFIVTVSVPGLSPAAVAGIVVAALLLSAAAAAGVMYYRRPRITNLPSKMWSVPTGDDVTLNPETEIQTGDEIQWLFGDEDSLIAGIKGKTRETPYDGPDKIFMNRLKLDETTGSLTITNTTTKHTGLYTLKIRRGRETLYKKFIVYVEARTIAVMEGDTITLNPDTKINKDDSIRWLFRDEEQHKTLIAGIRRETGKTFTREDVADGRFKDRLELDEKTGSLIIKDTRTSHSGVYTLAITSSSGVSEKTFIVTINDKVEKRLLNEGDSVTLNPDTEIQRDDQILWMFGAQDHLIAQIRGTIETCDDGVNKRFRDRLKLDKTGSLTIRNIRTEHTGLYKLLTISSSRGTLFKKFKVLIQSRYETVTAGESVTLKTDLTEKQTDDEIQWRFGVENSLIAEIKGGTVETYGGPNGRFRDRLKLNKTTGDLTIKNSASEHTGDYKLKILSSKGKTSRTFIVDIIVAAVSNEVSKQSSMKEKNENQVNESATVEMPLLNGDDLDVVNEEEGTSSL